MSLVIFDCDGVLVDSEIIAADVEAGMLREFGLDFSAEEFAVRFAGLTLSRILEILREETGAAIPRDFAEKADAAIDLRLGTDVEEVPGAHEVLDRIEQPRCICSNSSSARLRIELDHVGLWDRFRPYVFAAGEVGTMKGKPAPDVFHFACGEFGVPPREAIVLEDSVHGVAAAAAAGCRVVGFTGARHTYPGHAEALSEAGAETVISRLLDFPAVIDAFGEWGRD